MTDDREPAPDGAPSTAEGYHMTDQPGAVLTWLVIFGWFASVAIAGTAVAVVLAIGSVWVASFAGPIGALVTMVLLFLAAVTTAVCCA